MAFEAGAVYARVGAILDSSFNRVLDRATKDVDDAFSRLQRNAKQSLDTMGGLSQRQARLNKALDRAKIGSKRYRQIAEELGRVNNKLTEARSRARGFGQAIKKESGTGMSALFDLAGGTGWGAVINQGMRATQAVIGFGKETIASSNRAQNAALALATIIRTKIGSEAIPKATAETDRLGKALKGAMDTASIQAAMKNLISAGFTIEQSGKLIEANAKIASTSRQSHLGLAESVVVYAEGIKNQNSVLTDATGISENLSTTLKRAGFTMEDLTDATKGAEARQALFNRHMEEAIPFTEAFNEQMESYQGHAARADAATEKLYITIGDFLKDRLEPASGGWADFLEVLSEDITVESLDEVFDILSLVTDPLVEIQASTFEIWQLFGDLAQEIIGAKSGTDTLRGVFRLLNRAINLALTPVRAMHTAIKLIVGLAKALVRVFRGDFRGALDAAKGAFVRFGNNLLNILEKVRRAILGIFDEPEKQAAAAVSSPAGTPARKSPSFSGGGGGKSAGDKIKPTFRMDRGLQELEAAINLLEEGKTVRVDLRTVTGGDLFKELEKAGLSEESSKILQKTVELEVEVLNEDEVKQLSNTSDVSGSTRRNLERARGGEGPSEGTLQGTTATIATDDKNAAGALRELKEVIQKSRDARDAVVDLSAKTDKAGSKVSGLAQKIQKVLGVISELAGRASEIIQNGLRLQLQAMENAMARLNFFADFYLASFNKKKNEEIEAFRATENRKIELLREAQNERLALIDEELNAIKSRLEEELAIKIAQLEAEHLAQIQFIETNSADHEQELVLKELQEEDHRLRKEQLEAEHEEKLNEELKNANSKKEEEKRRSDKEIQKAEEAKNKELAKKEEERAAHERKIKKTMAALQWLHDLAGFKVEQQIARTQVQFSTAQAVMNAVASSMSLPFPVNLVVMGITTAMAAALGAQQMALIQGQTPPMPPVELFFRKGGIVPGRKTPADQVPAMLTGGEFVVNRESTARNQDLLETINANPEATAESLFAQSAAVLPQQARPAFVVLEEGSIKAILQLGDDELELVARGVTEKQGSIIHGAAF